MTTLLNGTLHSVKLGNRQVNYRIRHSRTAKKCRIRVRPDGVEVLLPRDTKDQRASSFLKENSSWVLDQLDFIARMSGIRAKPKTAVNQILLRGKQTSVEIIEEDSQRRCAIIEAHESGLRIRLPHGKQVDPWRALESWMRRQAHQDIRARLDERRKEMPKATFGRLYVMGQKTKWGGCSARRNLSFNWRLIMAPPAVLDYIVVHELAHLAEPFHSTKFWLIVRSHCPRFEEHRAWLKDNEHRMRLPHGTERSRLRR